MLNVQLKRKRTFTQSVLFVVFLLSSTLAFAQTKVTGTVTDKTGEPLAGVNVLEKARPTVASPTLTVNTL